MNITATEVEATEAVRLLDLIELFEPESQLRGALLYVLKQTYAGYDIAVIAGELLPSGDMVVRPT